MNVNAYVSCVCVYSHTLEKTTGNVYFQSPNLIYQSPPYGTLYILRILISVHDHFKEE